MHCLCLPTLAVISLRGSDHTTTPSSLRSPSRMYSLLVPFTTTTTCSRRPYDSSCVGCAALRRVTGVAFRTGHTPLHDGLHASASGMVTV